MYCMDQKIIIASDSTCDLGTELIQRYGIQILPLKVTLGEKSYTDGVDIDPDAIYAHYEAKKELPKTAAPTIADFESFFEEQFTINDSERGFKYWEVYDRTTNTKVEAAKWTYNMEEGTVTVKDIVPFHKYTVSFLAYRIWEEISMYNHTTNNWDKEHLMQQNL